MCNGKEGNGCSCKTGEKKEKKQCQCGGSCGNGGNCQCGGSCSVDGGGCGGKCGGKTEKDTASETIKWEPVGPCGFGC